MIEIVFSNDHFIVAHKPAGVLTVPDRTGAHGARRVLGLELQEQCGTRLYPVHRLDLVVAGLVLFAKDATAHRNANEWFERKLVHKTYRAWTTAQSFAHVPAHVRNERVALELNPGRQFEWRCKIARGKRRAFESKNGAPSITRAVYLGIHANGFLQWDAQPVTGRPHQLRFELSRHGFPVVGDALYGSGVEFGVDRIALKAYRLDFSALESAARFDLPDVITLDPEF